MSKEPPKVCGDTPSVDVTWKVLLNVRREPPLLSVSYEVARTAFSAFQKASPKLGNPSFSGVVCTIVEERQVSALEPKRKLKRKRKL
ncbi:MAG: hypothetical protein WC565_02095 [Parcubacteria group bacterium]